MNINVTSGGYEVVDTGSVVAFEEESDISFHFFGDNSFQFDLKITFRTDDTGKQTINRTVQGNDIEFTCTNFNDSGTGTSVPIELATFQGKKIYIRFWSYLLGDIPNQKKTRKIEYTFYAGK